MHVLYSALSRVKKAAEIHKAGICHKFSNQGKNIHKSFVPSSKLLQLKLKER